MFIKWLSVIVFAVATAAGLLVFRQQQIDAMHRMARQHSDVHRQQQVLWMLQSDIAANLQPRQLQSALERAELVLEPDLPQREYLPPEPARLAGH